MTSVASAAPDSRPHLLAMLQQSQDVHGSTRTISSSEKGATPGSSASSGAVVGTERGSGRPHCHAEVSSLAFLSCRTAMQHP